MLLPGAQPRLSMSFSCYLVSDKAWPLRRPKASPNPACPRSLSTVIRVLSKLEGDGIFELRHVGKLNTRVLWFFMKGRRIVAVHGIRNKGQAIPARDLDTARERKRDWLERTDR